MQHMQIKKWVSPNKQEGIELKREGKNLSDDRTLESLGIFNGLHMPLVTTFRIDWTTLYHKCMVCSAKGINNLPAGYWHHPGGNKAYFTSSKPKSGYIVEMKGTKIRCDGCKSESEYKDWQFKCDNHGFEKIQ